MRKIK